MLYRIQRENRNEEVLMKGSTVNRPISLGEFSLWSWLAVVFMLAILFLLLLVSGELLFTSVGQGAADYLHEFAHDGRHLLGVPCH
jgi:cobalt transporter subunit CbtB